MTKIRDELRPADTESVRTFSELTGTSFHAGYKLALKHVRDMTREVSAEATIAGVYLREVVDTITYKLEEWSK